jgi:hypothetical protein
MAFATLRRLSLIAALLVASACGPSVAEDGLSSSWMTADAIRSEFSGQALAGIYPSGIAWNEDIFADGTSDYREGTVRRPGQWWLTAREFCFRYLQPGVGGCFRIVKIGANCYELYSFGSELGQQEAPPRTPGGWNGRMWRTQTPSTCSEKPSV